MASSMPGFDRDWLPCWQIRLYFFTARTSWRASNVLCENCFSTYTSLPAWQAQLLDVTDALVQHVFVHIAQSGKLCSRHTLKTMYVIVSAASPSANCHADTVICAEDL